MEGYELHKVYKSEAITTRKKDLKEWGKKKDNVKLLIKFHPEFRCH